MSVKKPERNAPCPCGSGRKYKRCCGAEARPAPEPSAQGPALGNDASAAPAMPFDPSQLDPQMMMQMSQALQRLPKSQMHKLQSIMQRAMAGKDVSREAAELERMLPPKFKQMMEGFQAIPGMPGIPEMGGVGEAEDMTEEAEIVPDSSGSEDMSTDDARAIIEQAVAEGRLSKDEAARLIGDADTEAPGEDQKKPFFKKLWKS